MMSKLSVSCVALLLSLVAITHAQDGPPAGLDQNDFHLYLLAGQSNMAGRGAVAAEDKTPHPRVFVLNRLNRWVPAVDPLHFDKSWAGVGPGLTFGKVMAEADPNVTIGLIPCAVGGSPISVWKPHAYYQPVNVYPYDDMIVRYRIATQHGVLKGVLWHQGEGDSNPTDGPLYVSRLTELIQRLRTEFQVPNLLFVAGTFVDAYIARVPDSQFVLAAIRKVAGADENVLWITGAGLPCMDDRVHFNAAGARALGRRYAEAVLTRCDVTQPAP